MKVYPLFLCDLEWRRAVVIGGEGEAVAKVRGLLDVGADVTVVATAIDDDLRAAAAIGRLTWIPRDYRRGDLAGAFLVIAATRDPDLAERIQIEAESERALLNVIDVPDRSSFIAGSVVRRGALTVAISTSGVAPALAVRLRQRIEREVGAEYDAFLALLAEIRPRLAERHRDFETRRRVWYELVDSPALDQLRAGRPDEARRTLYRIAGCAG
jgi:siroheme synthase-like protein